MANETEFLSNEYMVFEADQVLTNDHLNQLFNYLDQQNRWTRNKLIGIGIVCGLDLAQKPGIITITKGCGVTSQGYLIIQEEPKDYTYYLPYAGIDQPKDLPFTYPGDLPFYNAFNKNKSIFSLLTDADYDALEADAKSGAQTISSANANKMLDDYAVVLFLEMSEMDLKNCDMFDCNNKGEKMLLNLRPLLVKKSDLPVLQKEQTATGKIDVTKIKQPVLNLKNAAITSALSRPLRVTTIGAVKGKTLSSGFMSSGIRPLQPFTGKATEINLKRFNVPYTDLKTTDDVINAFVKLVDDATLNSVADAYNYCYNQYKDLFDSTATGFPTLLNDLKAIRDKILKSYPVFIQYFYDFIDDLIKAYYEFRVKVSQLLSACCPDENLFPLHVVLGAATATTKDFAKDMYRTYFIYSPLFARQENEVSESQFLFRRMQILVSEFVTVAPADLKTFAIKISPGLYQDATLSQRVIPYYYTINEANKELYKYWSYYKTIRGNAAFNLSYNSYLYNNNTAVTEPLLYDIERYNFFRIEGHIGLNYQAALFNILQQRKNYNLPFDVVAISADQLPTGTGALPQCNMQDLDTDYKLLISEFSCKVHTPFCFITRLPYPPVAKLSATVGKAVNKEIINEKLTTTEAAKSKLTPLSFSTFKLQAADAININLPVFQLLYRKGDFMRKYCAPNANTIGSVYLNSLSNGVFINPVPLSINNSNLFPYFHLFNYIDAVESLMQIITPATLTTIDMNAFAVAYKRFADSLVAVTLSVTQILNDAIGNSDNATAQFFKDIEMDMLVNEISMPVYDCIDERLQTLQNEYKSRLQTYELQRSFYYYYNKHYGLEHKAGVPKGGTFVLVYHPEATIQNSDVTRGNLTANTSAFSTSSALQNTNIKEAASSVTGTKLFMAKAPKITPDKSDIKKAKAAAKEDKKDSVVKENVAGKPKVESKTTSEKPQASATPGKIAAQAFDTALEDMRTSVFAQPANTMTSQLSGSVQASDLLDQNTMMLIQNLAGTSANITSDNKKTILDFLTQARLQLVSSRYRIANNVVIADFYVPYLCCSDCSPVAYILQPQEPTPPTEIPEFNIASTEYVFTDKKTYPFIAKPLVTDTNQAQDPFSSANVLNPGNLNLLTDEQNILYLRPLLPDLDKTITTAVTYKDISINITIIKPDATFTIQESEDAAGRKMIQPVLVDVNADNYKWTVNGIEDIFENTKAPSAISVIELERKLNSNSFTVTLTVSYTRNGVTANDTKEQVYQSSAEPVCIEFEDPFVLGTVYGPQVGQQEGETIFTIPQKVIGKVQAYQTGNSNAFGGVAFIAQAPQNFGSGNCLQINNIAIQFDYSNSASQPTKITLRFLSQGGDQNFSVNDSDTFIGQLAQIPAQMRDVKTSVIMANDRMGTLIMQGDITTFTIGGQEFFIDHVCAQ